MADSNEYVQSHLVTWADVHRDSKILVRTLLDLGPWQGIVALTRGGRRYHTERPSLNYVFRRCAAFRFACGRQFVMPDVLHEGAFPRADGVDVPIHHRERTMRVVPRRDGSPVLDATYRASLGLDALDGP